MQIADPYGLVLGAGSLMVRVRHVRELLLVLVIGDIGLRRRRRRGIMLRRHHVVLHYHGSRWVLHREPLRRDGHRLRRWRRRRRRRLLVLLRCLRIRTVRCRLHLFSQLPLRQAPLSAVPSSFFHPK
ncbi:hypothetical protein V8G54_006540 [Vigna mungo]|uniref:Uncharacterized protein n=1 Tax=Vigna mungo TaxID=3915 RepID=A0AAQ3S7F2_VIGMU